MNKLLLFAILIIASRSYAQRKSVQFEAEIKHPNSDSLVIHNKQFKTTLKGNNGQFSATLDAPEGIYQLFDGAAFATIYLRPGFELKMKMDTKAFRQSLFFSGLGAAANNFIAKKVLDDQKIKENFGDRLPQPYELQQILNLRLEKAKSLLILYCLDSTFSKTMLATYEVENKRIMDELLAVKAKADGIKALNGKLSEEFEYENHKGGKTKLSSLRGRYVYIDIWATWCIPCRTEIPYLQNMAAKYHHKNISFMGIALDQPKDYARWRRFVTDQNLVGIQLYADNAFQSDWVKKLAIDAIPRFILINPEGKIVAADAPRPSSTELQRMLDSLIK